jgi:hypothetical protein
VTYYENQHPSRSNIGFLPANDTASGIQYNLSLTEVTGIGETILPSASYQLTLSEAIVLTQTSLTLDVDDQLFLVLYDSANNSFKSYHGLSKKHKKRIFNRTRKKLKKLRRLEDREDSQPAIREYKRIVDEAMLQSAINS